MKRIAGISALVAVLAFVAGSFAVSRAQDAKATGAKGVEEKNLVTSLGPYKGVASIPVVMTGKIVEIAPGGQTGQERFLVPSYIYVLEGTLTTDTKEGPIGVKGIQYTAAGQSYSDPVGVWHNHMNGGQKPVRYLLLLVGTPGGPTVEGPKGE